MSAKPGWVAPRRPTPADLRCVSCGVHLSNWPYVRCLRRRGSHLYAYGDEAKALARGGSR